MSSARGELYQAVERHVEASFPPTAGTVPHLKKTAANVERLRPGADETLLIAAVTHDLERSASEPNPHRSKGYQHPDFLRHHQETGAAMITEFLVSQDAPPEVVERVRHLVSKHEVGGDQDQDLLMDADSLSFYEGSIDAFLTKKLAVDGWEEIHEKLQWMYARISSEQARELARPFYEDAMGRLELLKPQA